MTDVRSPTGQLPALGVLALAGLGLVVAAVVEGQLGAFVIALALLLAAGLRLALPTERAGWLAVRSRGLDAALLLVVGFALAVLAVTVPDA